MEAEWIERITKIDDGRVKSAIRQVRQAERQQAGQTRALAERGKEYERYRGTQDRLYEGAPKKAVDDDGVNQALGGPLFLELWPPGRLYSGRRWCFSGDDLDPRLESLGLEFSSLSLRVERIVKEPTTGLETAYIRGDLYTNLP